MDDDALVAAATRRALERTGYRVVAARPEVRVPYTSGYTVEATNQQAVLEPDDAFLGKPFTPDSLLRAVHALVEPA